MGSENGGLFKCSLQTATSVGDTSISKKLPEMTIIPSMHVPLEAVLVCTEILLVYIKIQLKYVVVYTASKESYKLGYLVQ